VAGYLVPNAELFSNDCGRDRHAAIDAQAAFALPAASF
jgi:hypothetical protein